MQLKGKTGLLTGGTDGIGKELALQLRVQGANVMMPNLLRPISLTSALLSQLRVRPEAMIVNVTSGLAIAPNDHATYCASKAGLRAHTMSLRHQLRCTGVHVLEALPPLVDTQMNASKTEKKMPAPECARQIVRAMSSSVEDVNIGVVKRLRAIYSVSPAVARRNMIAS